MQAFVEQVHRTWPVDRDYLAPPSHGKRVTLDPALPVVLPKDPGGGLCSHRDASDNAMTCGG